MGSIYPLAAHAKIVLLGAVASVPALLFKYSVKLPAALELAGVAGLLLSSYAALGLVTGQITREDLRYVRGWLHL